MDQGNQFQHPGQVVSSSPGIEMSPQQQQQQYHEAPPPEYTGAPEPQLTRPSKAFPAQVVRHEADRPTPNPNMQYSAQQESAAKTVAVGNPLYVTPLGRLGEQPTYVDCPVCRERTLTRVQKSDSSMTNLAGLICCCFTLICTCVPCLCGWCQDIDNYCSKCGTRLTHQPHDGIVQVVEIRNGATAAPVVPSQYAVVQQPQRTFQGQGQTQGQGQIYG